MSLLTREHINITYRQLFDDFNSDEAERLFIHLLEFEEHVSKLAIDKLAVIQQHLRLPILQQRLEYSEYELIEFTPRQMELLVLECEGLVSWYIKDNGGF